MDKQETAANPHESSSDRAYDEDEKAFLAAHRKASFWSAVSFALAGATFIGVLSTFSARLIGGLEKNAENAMKRQAGMDIPAWDSGKLFKNKYTPWLMGGMVAFGAACTFISNWLESKKTLLEWRMGGSKVGRKLAAASENQAEAQTAPLAQGRMPSPDNMQGRTDGKSWQEATAKREQVAQFR